MLTLVYLFIESTQSVESAKNIASNKAILLLEEIRRGLTLLSK